MLIISRWCQNVLAASSHFEIAGSKVQFHHNKFFVTFLILFDNIVVE